MKRTVLRLFFLCSLTGSSLNAQVATDVILANPLPAELSTWENDPSLLQIIIVNSGAGSYRGLRLSFFVRDEENGDIVVESQNDRIPVFDVPALATVTRLGPDVYAGNAVTISDRISTLAAT